jgi:hypothetical protein
VTTPGPEHIADTEAGRGVIMGERLVAPRRPQKARPLVSGWDRWEDPPRPDPALQAKLKALDEHVARARLSAQNCWVR